MIAVTATLAPPVSESSPSDVDVDIAVAASNLDEPTAPVAPRPRSDTTTPSRPRRERIALLGVTALALGFNTWGLDRNRLGNVFYAAAVRGMATSWHNFFFAAWDPGGFISVDKPPVAVWASALSARVFGYGSWSLLLPSAIAGAAAVALLWCTVRRSFGPLAATVAGVVLALTPISIAVDRLNLPEPFLILALIAAVASIVRSFDDADHAWRWLVVAGICVGIAFNTKMLVAYIPVPAMALAIFIGNRGWWRRIGRAALFGAVTLVASAPWMLAVALTPRSQRPFVGGSTNDSVTDLVFGYNGIGRIRGGGSSNALAHASARGRMGGIIAGSPGPTRMLTPSLSVQVTWLLPLVIVGLAAALWHHRHDRRRLAATAAWAGWLALFTLVFSDAAGVFHAYYTSVMVPAIAVAVGLGVAEGWRLIRARPRIGVASAAAVVALVVAWQIHLTGLSPNYFGWVRPWIPVLASVGIVVAAAAVLRGRTRVLAAGLVLAAVGLLFAPTSWAASEMAARSLNTTLPQAGPRSGTSGHSFGAVWSDGSPALGRFLRRHRDGRTWDLAVANSQVGSGLIAYEHLSVLSLGGFTGRDPTIGPVGFADLVAAGKVRYVATPPTSLVAQMRIIDQWLLAGVHAAGAVTPTARAIGPTIDPSGQRTPHHPLTPTVATRHLSGRVLANVEASCRPLDLHADALDLVPGIGQLWDCAGRVPVMRANARHGRGLGGARTGGTR